MFHFIVGKKETLVLYNNIFAYSNNAFLPPLSEWSLNVALYLQHNEQLKFRL